jgi:hypothetical protein
LPSGEQAQAPYRVSVSAMEVLSWPVSALGTVGTLQAVPSVPPFQGLTSA